MFNGENNGWTNNLLDQTGNAHFFDENTAVSPGKLATKDLNE